jgi:RNA polymerase sigma-70 factor (ECF subfamily)
VTVSECDHEWLASQFEAHRSHLRGVAYRMLGSTSEADDAVQEAWLRLSRTGGDGVENLGGWLTTVVGRIALDMLRSRTSRREEPLPEVPHINTGPALEEDPEQAAMTADAVGLALLVVLETLTPSERVAFVLHDLFAVPFDEIAPIVGRTPAAARQLASRARRRVQGANDGEGEIANQALQLEQRRRKREIVEAFLAASRQGDFAALLAALDPNVVMRADAAAREMGAAPEIVGADAVAEMFSGGAKVARLALIDGVPGLVWMEGKSPRVVFDIAIADGKINGITLRADADYLERCEVDLVHQRRGKAREGDTTAGPADSDQQE